MMNCGDPEERDRDRGQSKYVIKFYIDPEDAVAETDELNNLLESKIKIKV